MFGAWRLRMIYALYTLCVVCVLRGSTCPTSVAVPGQRPFITHAGVQPIRMKSGRPKAWAAFKPCIDLHQGRVKQIVGSTLRDLPEEDGGGGGGAAAPVTNFESELSSGEYARMYALPLPPRHFPAAAPLPF